MLLVVTFGSQADRNVMWKLSARKGLITIYGSLLKNITDRGPVPETGAKRPRVRNAYLLVHSDRTGLHINLAEGAGDNGAPAPQQPNYMASVGKLFTSVVVCRLHERDYCPLRIPSAATSITD